MSESDPLRAAHEAIDDLCGEMHRDDSTVPSNAPKGPCPVCEEAHAALERAVRDAMGRKREHADGCLGCICLDTGNVDAD